MDLESGSLLCVKVQRIHVTGDSGILLNMILGDFPLPDRFVSNGDAAECCVRAPERGGFRHRSYGTALLYHTGPGLYPFAFCLPRPRSASQQVSKWWPILNFTTHTPTAH